MTEAGRPATPDDFTTLGSISINLPGEGISLSSQSALPPVGPHHMAEANFSYYTPKHIPALSPQPSPDNNRENVMSALKKLQEKIRQLEVERSTAEGNLRSLANETTRYRELLNKERSFKPYEPVQTEVSKNTQELQSQLSCAENRCGLLEKQLDYMRKLVQDSEADKARLVERRARESLSQDKANKVEIQKLNEIERDHLRLSQNQNQAEEKIKVLEKKLTNEIENRRKVEEKLKTSLPVNSPKEKRKLKKKTAPKGKSPKVQYCEATQRLHYHLNLNEMPFLQGKSTSPSHNVSANVQKVLALMKSHNNVMCEKPGSPKLVVETPSNSSSSSDSDLNELILQLQDEYAQMGFEHKELSAHLAEEENEQEQEDLERELELLTAKMEIKSEQINQLKHHLQTMDRKKMKRKVKSVKKPVAMPTASTLATAQRSRSAAATTTPRPGSADREGRLQILRDMKKLQSSLRPDDLSWDR